MYGGSAGSVLFKFVFGSVLGSVWLLLITSFLFVVESCFDLLCSCVTYCNNLGLI